MIDVYTFWRSSASYRVRIALALKGIDYQPRSLSWSRGGGEQHGAEYRALNPQGRVPLLCDGDVRVSQSLAIIEYLEDTHPEPPLLPKSAAARARVRSLAQIIACDIQPLQNLATTQYLSKQLQCSDAQVAAWLVEWITRGMSALETLAADDQATGRFLHGDMPTLADCCLVPQCYSARRFKVDMAQFPTLQRIEAHCVALPAFLKAAPEQQFDRT